MTDTDAALDIPAQFDPRALTADLSGRTALITGAASGIGRACAIALAGAGATVRVVDLDGAGAAEVAGQLGGEHRIVDLVDLVDLHTMHGLAAELTQGVDIVVNNAGFQVVRPLEDFPPEDFRRMLAVMVEAPFRLVRAALPGMYERGWGRVVNISSVHGLRASAFKAGYVTAKHALEGLSKVIAVEGAAHGVTSNCINPGYVRTPLVEKQIDEQAAAHGLPRDQVISQVLLARSAVKRLIEPDQVAALALYLCTEPASFVSGASLAMDGAWTAQ